MYYSYIAIYKGESKSKGKIHLTALIEVIVYVIVNINIYINI